MVGSKDDGLIKLASQASKQFVDTYYAALNSNRSAIPGFYHPDATISWNGNACVGGEAFAALFAPIPPSYYDVQSFDSHPMGRNEKGSTNIMIVVSGAVKYGESNSKPRGFSDTFVLRPEEQQQNKFKIASQGFRLVSS